MSHRKISEASPYLCPNCQHPCLYFLRDQPLSLSRYVDLFCRHCGAVVTLFENEGRCEAYADGQQIPCHLIRSH